MKKFKKVYICSPYRGDVAKHCGYAIDYCRWAALEHNVMPIAPHVYFSQFLNDDIPEQRQLGLLMRLKLLQECSEVWVFGDKLSDGMAAEITEAMRLEKKIRFFTVADGKYAERNSKEA